jgi:gliding motility-associated-like protein
MVKRHSGYGRVIFFIYYVPGLPIEGREYIASPLKSSLQANKKYCIDFYTLPGKESKYGCNSIGVFFGQGHQYYNTFSIPPIVPQSNLLLSTPITDTSKWFHYVDIYTATGAETDVVIGNFMNDNQITTPIINGSPFVSANGAYFVVDDVSLHEMSLEIGNDTTVCEGTSLTIGEKNLDTAFNGYYWFHNGVLFDSIVSQKTISFAQTDSFVVEKRFACGSVWDTIRVVVDAPCPIPPAPPEVELIIPNVFSPNGDGVNDCWQVKSNGIVTEGFKCSIYNRWGIVIFETTQVNDKWGGRTTSGVECNAGVYYYTIEFTNAKGDLEKRNGYVSLVR